MVIVEKMVILGLDIELVFRKYYICAATWIRVLIHRVSISLLFFFFFKIFVKNLLLRFLQN